MIEHRQLDYPVEQSSKESSAGTHIIPLKESQIDGKIVDQDLWVKLKSGCDQAFKELYLKFHHLLLNYGLSIVSDKSVVEDCVHDLFLYLWSKRTSLSKVESVKYYLLVCFRRRIFKFLESKEISRKLLEGIKYEYPKHEDYFEEKFVTSVSTAEREMSLKVAVDNLPLRQKELIYHRYIEALSYQEITLKMNISNVSARKLASKAIKNLRKKLF